MINVLHIITRLDPGGSSAMALSIIAGLNGSRFRCTLLYGRTEEFPPQALTLRDERKVTMVAIPQLVRPLSPLKDLMAFWRIWHFIRRGHFDVVHTHSSKAGFLGRIAAWAAGTPLVVHTPHGHVFYGYYGPILSRFFVLLEKAAACVTHRIIALTDREIREHVERGIASPEKFITIPGGVDVSACQLVHTDTEETRRQLPIPGESPLVGTVGRLEPIKGHRYFIEAIPSVLKKVPHCRFVLVGDGPLRTPLERRAAELGLEGNVAFTGWREDRLAVMAACDLLVFPSLNEGMGLAVVEAMALGKAIVASAVGGIPDIIHQEQNGLLVPPQDSPALAEAIIDLLLHPQKRTRLGAEGKREASRYTIDAMLQKIDQLYEELLREREWRGGSW